MFHENHIYIVKWEKKQECVQILKICPDCGFMNVSITNVLDKQQQRELGDSYWPANLINRYCYSVWRSVVTYLYVKRDKWHVTCSVYWNWLPWKKKRWFVCLLNLVMDSLSPFYNPAYGILVGRHDIEIYIPLLCLHAYIYMYVVLGVYVYVYIYSYICVYVCVYIHIHTSIYIYISIIYLPVKFR